MRAAKPRETEMFPKEAMLVSYDITVLLGALGLPATPGLQAAATVLMIVLVCALTYLVLLYGLWGTVKRYNRKTPRTWLTLLIDSNVFTHVVSLIQALMVNGQIRLWIPTGTLVLGVFDSLTKIWALVAAMLLTFACVNLANRALTRTRFAHKFPINGICQAIKLVFLIIFLILIVSIILNRSPVLVISGLSAMTAVLMLVFKDSIVGFVSGLQLSGYNMLAIGDWVEMPKYNADGDVVDIGLMTVRVQNWDKTIVTIPTYAFVSESFKNWSGMTEAGGRRIKRSVYIDIQSIHFLADEEIARLKKAALLSGYLEKKAAELKAYNEQLGVDLASPINGRHLTNIGTFRAYLQSYLEANPNVHKGLTLMVRQLAPSPEGLPIEIYAFTNTTSWGPYESIQADIFDHVYAVLPEFGLRAYQAPSGNDFRGLAALRCGEGWE